MGDAYLLNGLRAWKAARQREHRTLMGRYTSLERQMHPSQAAQGKLIDLNRKIIEMIDQAIADAEDSTHG